MIQLTGSVDDVTNLVTLSVLSSDTTVSIYRQIGQAIEMLLVSGLPVNATTGVATYRDISAPQKVLLQYAAVNETTFERTTNLSFVLPSGYSLARPTLTGDIHLGNMTFNTIDDDGIVWTVTDIDGWWNLPEASVPTQDKNKIDDGSYDENGRYLARQLTFSGMFLPPSPGLIPQARAKLAAAFNSVRNPAQLRLDDTPPRAMTVRLNGKTDITTTNAAGLTSFSIELLAADPLKYSLDTSKVIVGSGTILGGRSYPHTGGRSYASLAAQNVGTLTNQGDYSTPPVITITGPVVNPRIELIGTGKFMNFSLTLLTGDYLTIDVSEKTVILNNTVSRRGAMSLDSTWFTVPPGSSLVRYTAATATGDISRATISINSAWIG